MVDNNSTTIPLDAYTDPEQLAYCYGCLLLPLYQQKTRVLFAELGFSVLAIYCKNDKWQCDFFTSVYYANSAFQYVCVLNYTLIAFCFMWACLLHYIILRQQLCTWYDILKESPPLSPPIFTHTSSSGMQPPCHVNAFALKSNDHLMPCFTECQGFCINYLITCQAPTNGRPQTLIGSVCIDKEHCGSLPHLSLGMWRASFLLWKMSRQWGSRWCRGARNRWCMWFFMVLSQAS